MGGGAGPQDLELRKQLEDMEAEQRNAWEQKEKLSRCVSTYVL